MPNRKATPPETTQRASGSTDSMLVWHPEVHARFGEELMYFLLAIKPFKREEYDAGVRKVMDKFGVLKYCSYHLYGSFDSLLRVWLPPLIAGDFKREIEKLSGFRCVYDFRVVSKRLCWVNSIAEHRGVNISDIKDKAMRLDVDDVRAAQSGEISKNVMEKLERDCMLVRRPSEGKSESIKAFIAFSPPEQNYNKQIQEIIEMKIQEILAESHLSESNRKRNFKNVTLMFGQGFCWGLAKVVAHKYSDLGKCVDEASSALSIFGISTHTHLLVDYPPAIEGDCISGEALKQTLSGDPLVASFLPELYEPSPTGVVQVSNVERSIFEDFVKAIMGKNSLSVQVPKVVSMDDLFTIKQFLKASVVNDRDAAFIALFPALKNAERRLREPVGRAAAKFYPGGVRALLDFLRQQKANPPPSLDKMTLRDLLQAGRVILANSSTSQDIWLENLKDKDFEEIGEVRNTVAHDKPFEPRRDWKPYAERVLKLFEIRDGFERRYQQLENLERSHQQLETTS